MSLQPYAPGRHARNCPRSGFTLIELLVVISIIALLVTVLLPALQGAREAAKQIACGTQMRQVAMAFHMYADEHDDYLPPVWRSATEQWLVQLQPYGISSTQSTVRRCPSASQTYVGNNGLIYYTYGRNTTNAGGDTAYIRRTNIPRPAGVFLLGETVEMLPATPGGGYKGFNQNVMDRIERRHNDAANFAYVDCHVEVVDPLPVLNDPQWLILQ